MKSFLVPSAVVSCLFLCILPCCTHLKIPASKRVYTSCSPQEILPIIVDTGIPGALKGIAKVKVRSSDETFSVKECISAQNPYYLRLETLNPLGHPEFYAVTDGREVFIFVPSEKKFYFGNASLQTVSLFIPLSLSIEELVQIILGRIPLIDYHGGLVSCEGTDDLYNLRLSAKDGSMAQLLKINQDNHTVLESETYEEEGKLVIAVQFGDYEMIGDVLFPKKINIFMPNDKTRVMINYKKVEILAEISSDEFRLTAPQGVEVVPLK